MSRSHGRELTDRQREGKDVPEVGVILLLRKSRSRVYERQVIWYGLQCVRVKEVDHPKLVHHCIGDG